MATIISPKYKSSLQNEHYFFHTTGNLQLDFIHNVIRRRCSISIIDNADSVHVVVASKFNELFLKLSHWQDPRFKEPQTLGHSALTKHRMQEWSTKPTRSWQTAITDLIRHPPRHACKNTQGKLYINISKDNSWSRETVLFIRLNVPPSFRCNSINDPVPDMQKA